MNRDRLWLIAAGAGMVIVALLGWFLGVSPVLTQTADSDAQVSALRAANAASEARLSSLKTEYAQIGSLRDRLGLLRQSIPADAAAATFLREINTLGENTHVTLMSVTINNATVYENKAAVVTPPAGGAAGASTPTPTPTPSAPAGGAAVAPPAATNPFVLVPVSIGVNGKLENVLAFMKGIQLGQRLYFASGMGIAASEAFPDAVTGTLTGDAFALTGTSDVKATPVETPTPSPTPSSPATTSTPTPTGAATASPTPSSTPTP